MYSQLLTIRRVSVVAALAVCVALPISAWAAPPESNPGQPFAEMSAQHGMIQQDIDDAQTAIQADLAEVKDLVEALDGQGAPPCGAGTEGQRFVVDDSNDPTEVCDNTTGLYWEQSPSRSAFVWSPDGGATTPAIDHCTGLDLGNGQVYRLAEVKELVSLVDYSEFTPAGALNDPNGPFEDVLAGSYWSAPPLAFNPAFAWGVNFGDGVVDTDFKGIDFHAWCVR